MSTDPSPLEALARHPGYAEITFSEAAVPLETLINTGSLRGDAGGFSGQTTLKMVIDHQVDLGRHQPQISPGGVLYAQT